MVVPTRLVSSELRRTRSALGLSNPQRVDVGAALYTVGWLVLILAAFMLVPLAVDFARAGPTRDLHGFAASTLITAFGGGLLVLSFQRGTVALSLRSAYLMTTASWVVLAGFGALPFLLGAAELGPADAYFEAMSGLTTTGATVITGLDDRPPGLLLWRALLQWLGGVGIIVGAIFILPFLKVGGMQLFRLESSEKFEKFEPRLGVLVGEILLLYAVVTLACTLLLRFAGLTVFDAVTHAMTSVATAGYSTRDASVGALDNPLVEWIIVAFMLAGSLPFLRVLALAQGDWRSFARDSQIRLYLWFLVAVCAGMILTLYAQGGRDLVDAARLVIFNVVSIVTTTGFTTADYSLWGPFFVAAFLGLMIVGGCTGSTAGGVKFFRFEILWLGARDHIRRLFSPHAVVSQTYSGKRVTNEIVLSVISFVFLFFMTWGLVTVALGALGLDLVTAVSASASAVANIGPGLGPIVGPGGTFAPLPDAAKWVLSFAMLLGRLEIFTVIVLLVPRFWRS